MSISDLVKSLDGSKMLDLILAEPVEFEEYYRKYGEMDLHKIIPRKLSQESWKNVIIAGMGGSAIAGDLVRSLTLDSVEVPIEVVRGFKLPAYLGKDTLLIAVSYSGNTIETLECAIRGVTKGAQLIAITSGGELERVASKSGGLIYKLPVGRPPRTAVAPMLAACLRAFEAAGLLKPIAVTEVTQGLRRVMEVFKQDPQESLPTKLAVFLKGKVPLIYSYQPYSSVGFRLKTQINENAKYHAFFAELPEANHNEIMGWEGELTARYHAVFIRGSEETAELKVIIEFWKVLLKEREVNAVDIVSSGGSRLSEILELLGIVDLTSYVLALHQGVDPTPVATIGRLKETMKSIQGL